MTNTAVVVASFGTTHDDARKACIDALEAQVEKTVPGVRVVRAFTSSIVRRLLLKRGIHVDSPEEALDRLAAAGIRQVVVLPSHIMAGYEYDKLAGVVADKAELFDKTVVASPLVGNDADGERLMDIVLLQYPTPKGEGLVLMGHGTSHAAQDVYHKMNAYLKACGHENVFIATVEEAPGLEEAMDAMCACKARRVTLAPLMFVAGDHAKNDMAGGEDSWLAAFEKETEATAVIRGLGEMEDVRRMYIAHLDKAMSGLKG